MGDTLKKVQSGDPLVFPAQTFNAFIDAAKDYQQRQRNLGSDQQHATRQTGIVPIRNDTTADLERFDIVGLDAPIILPTDNEDEFKNRAMLVGVKPQLPQHWGQFAVTLEPVAAGKVGMGCVSGVVPGRINVEHESHFRADIEHDSVKLKSGHHGGAEILWKESGTGLKWALLKVGIAEPLGITFIVRLEQVEGEAGINGAATCTYAYDVFDLLTGEKLNRDDIPRAPIDTNIRPAQTQMVAATRGSAFWTVENNKITIKLEEAFEYPTPRKVLDVVTAIECGPVSPGLAGEMNPDCCRIQLTYYTTRVYFPAGTRFEEGPTHTIVCECCGDSSYTSSSGSS